MNLDVKGAVRVAKQYVTELFAEEGIVHLGLEEVERDDSGGLWLITLGLSRAWDKDGRDLNPFAIARRAYKIISVTDAGQVVSVKNRETADAG